MSRPAVSGLDTDPIPRVDGPRHRLPHSRSTRRIHAAGRVLAGLAAVAVLAVTAVGWAGYRNLSGSITTSQALVGGPESVGGAQNILIMGLDSRLDQHGQPLPEDIYDALHAGNETVGGYNANVLIVLHLPGGNSPVSAVSAPRDDYVDLPGCPSGICKGKIKQAYGLAYRQSMDSLSDNMAQSSREQKAREAGRKAEIDTVRRLLGVPIDHFVEVTLGAFFQIAQVVQPITVCLNNDTSDSYSGADFHRGVQQIDAAQAMAFVRQRRDENDQLFTDMDRTRRQQAFIVSLVTALRHGGALSSPSSLRNLLQVAQQNIAVDDGFGLAGFVDQAASLTDSSLTLYTLPISNSARTPWAKTSTSLTCKASEPSCTTSSRPVPHRIRPVPRNPALPQRHSMLSTPPTTTGLAQPLSRPSAPTDWPQAQSPPPTAWPTRAQSPTDPAQASRRTCWRTGF